MILLKEAAKGEGDVRADEGFSIVESTHPVPLSWFELIVSGGGKRGEMMSWGEERTSSKNEAGDVNEETGAADRSCTVYLRAGWLGGGEFADWGKGNQWKEVRSSLDLGTTSMKEIEHPSFTSEQTSINGEHAGFEMIMLDEMTTLEFESCPFERNIPRQSIIIHET
ncbi:hypothetical protein BLNAU_23019 [Blattamonas nauphoetae]|uniref:Uncharacterized protein n=1 Tax=Blattamonas nauphoetae TaxID=2049346 RepID=A0ABQ9WUI7_9EUKA|nr:hypothetical protein BLNAU_23019 [Blattamonas nauphoetae]